MDDKRHLFLYTPFARSDIVLSSPLGLIGLGEGGVADVLSSVEIFIILDAHLTLMQNFDHVREIWE